MNQVELIDELFENQNLSKDKFHDLIEHRNSSDNEYLFKKARIIQNNIFQKNVYLRGLIEFSNVCKSDCLYCGIRKVILKSNVIV